VRDTADDAVVTVLIQPFEVGAVRRRLRVVEAGDGRKGLALAVQRPAVDDIADVLLVDLEEGADAGDIDAEIAVGDGAAGLELALLERGGGQQPVVVIPGDAVKAGLIDAGGIDACWGGVLVVVVGGGGGGMPLKNAGDAGVKGGSRQQQRCQDLFILSMPVASEKSRTTYCRCDRLHLDGGMECMSMQGQY
jgi:hypothetical protein